MSNVLLRPISNHQYYACLSMSVYLQFFKYSWLIHIHVKEFEENERGKINCKSVKCKHGLVIIITTIWLSLFLLTKMWETVDYQLESFLFSSVLHSFSLSSIMSSTYYVYHNIILTNDDYLCKILCPNGSKQKWYSG